MTSYEQIKQIMDQIKAMPDAIAILAKFRSFDTAVETMKRMSFVTVEQEGIVIPKNIHCAVFKTTTGAMVVIGGTLSEHEFVEIFRLCERFGSIDSITGREPSLIKKFERAVGKRVSANQLKTKRAHVIAKWYFVENTERHVRQVVLELPVEAEVPARLKGSLMDTPDLMGALRGVGFAPDVSGALIQTDFVKMAWASFTWFMAGDTPDQKGPFVFCKANNVVDHIRGCRTRVAFSFYRFRTGGLLQIFVRVDSPQVQAQAGYPFITENAHWPENHDTKEVIPALLRRQDLEVCFIADTPAARCQGKFGLRVAIPDNCRAILKKEWEALNEYHFAIPESRRDRRDAFAQFHNENPLEENPVLDPVPSGGADNEVFAEAPQSDSKNAGSLKNHGQAVSSQLTPKTAGTRQEICEYCHGTISSRLQAYVLRGKIACEECDKKLRGPSPT